MSGSAPSHPTVGLPATNPVPAVGATLHPAPTPPSALDAETVASVDAGLKHLNFIASTATTAATTAGSVANTVYTTTKGFVPSSLLPTVNKLEDTAVSYAAPVIATAQDTGLGLLKHADHTVEAAVNTASNLLGSTKQTVASTASGVKGVQEHSVKTFKDAATTYFDFVTSTADWVAERLSLTSQVTAAKETLNKTIAKAREMSDPDVAVGTVFEAWTAFAEVPAVNKVLTTAEPVTKRGLSTFYSLHDYLVASPYYKAGLNTGASTAAALSQTTPYKLTKQYAYPIIAPYADPLLDKLNSSIYLKQLQMYWMPVVPPGSG